MDKEHVLVHADKVEGGRGISTAILLVANVADRL